MDYWRGRKAPIGVASSLWLCWRNNSFEVVRVGRDVVTSVLDDESEYHVSVQRYVDIMQLIYGFVSPRHFHVRYEHLVTDHQQCLDEVFSYLGEKPDPDALDNYRKQTMTRDPSTVRQPKLKQPITTAWIGRWREPEHKHRIAEFMANERAVSWLRRSGYEI